MRRTSSLAALVLLASTGCGAAARATVPDADGRYPITLERPARVGFRFAESSSYHSRTVQIITVANQPGETTTEETTATFAAEGEVVAVRDDGHASVLRYVVRTLSRTDGGATEVLARPGAVLEVHVGHSLETASATLDGVPLDAAQLEHIHDVVDLSSSGERDDLFASAEPRRVGESWSPDMAAITSGLSGAGSMRIDPARSNGRMTLVSHETRDGVPGIVVEGVVASGGIEVPMPPGAAIREANMDVHFGGFFPDDVSSPPLADQMRLDMRVVIDMASPAGPVLLVMEVVSAQERTIRPL